MADTPETRTAHPYHMHDCISDQPEAIAQVLQTQGDAAQDLADRISRADRVHIVGIGTSWHASLIGEHFLREVGGRQDARAWNSFEFRAYPPTLTGQDLVIVMAHTGTTTYSNESLAYARESGAVTALVTGLDSKADLNLADVVLRTSYGDRSSAYTISHTAAMTALAMVAARLSGASGALSDLEELPSLVKAALALEPDVQQITKEYDDMRWYAFAGPGASAVTAYEIALKINEAAYAITTGYQLEQYLHGPFVATTEGCLVTLITPPGPGAERSNEIAKAVKETGAEIFVVQECGFSKIEVADARVELPPTPDFLTSIVYLVPLQLFTYWLAVERGHNPDTFRMDHATHKAALEHTVL